MTRYHRHHHRHQLHQHRQSHQLVLHLRCHHHRHYQNILLNFVFQPCRAVQQRHLHQPYNYWLRRQRHLHELNHQ
jgi:hypothetical protein